MDKQKQIEEMVDLYIQHAILAFDKHGFSATARQMYIEKSRITMFEICSLFFEAGYRKIPENAVVLTREDYDKLCQKIADLQYDKDILKQLEDENIDLKYDKFELKNEISEKDNKIALLEETIECIKFNVDFTRKETAEKFANGVEDLLKQPFEGKTEKQEYQHKGMEEGLRMALEIAKEITESK